MRYLTICFLLTFLVFSTKLNAQQTIYVPWSPDAYYDFSINEDVVVKKAGTKHILSSSTIKGVSVDYATKLELDLSGYMSFAFDEKILSPKYNYKTDKNDSICRTCKGRFTMFIPYRDISRIIFKKFEIAEVHLKGHSKPIYAYIFAVKISGDENQGGFGKGTFKAELREPGDEIVFPVNSMPEAKIKALSNLSAVVHLKNGMQKKLSDFRPRTIALESNGSKVAFPVDKIRKIQVHKPRTGAWVNGNHSCTMQLITGEEKNFEIDWFAGGFAGVAGKGEHWYEAIDWNNIQSIHFLRLETTVN